MPGFADVSGDAFFSGLIGNRKTEFVGVLGDPAGGGAGGEARKIRIPYQTEVHDVPSWCSEWPGRADPIKAAAYPDWLTQ